ncbi:hypothetical protein CERZMDRAFT_103383 [Cercospora zeae-maydis SCOH1-5]|uniref:Uncharacterized protein n=1 Tax=Cercospora zeae-maydis SCOH1-5 TaxID=717836 RepID=A0A6A6F1S3_9PEZI|nr:hypothetical protein CERZMDRAFT_103383 [Cercospora zeae-maydis SCOH1-5]
MTTPQQSEQCSNFCCSDFYNMAEQEVKRPTDPLQNDIHPIFGRDKFVVPGWIPGLKSKSADEEYQCLGPSLRLASRLMTTDAFMKHVVTVADGDIYLDATNSKSVRRGRKVETLSETFTPDGRCRNILIYPRQRRVNDAMRLRARRIMNQLVDFVTFSVGTVEDGACCAAAMGPLPRNVPSCFFAGRLSVIELQSWARHQFREARRNPHLPERAVLMAHFMYATFILHETFGHALMNARFNSRAHEPWFQNRTASEAGYELQNALFGGIVYDQYVQLHHDDQRQIPPCRDIHGRFVLTMSAWPSSFLSHHYLSRGLPMGHRVPVGHFDSIVRVPDTFLSDIQSERFWTWRRLFSSSKELEEPLVPRNGPRWIFKYCGPRRQLWTNCNELPDEGLWVGEGENKYSPARIGPGRGLMVFVGSASSAGNPEWVGKEIKKIAARRSLRERGLRDDHVAMAGRFMEYCEPMDVCEPVDIWESDDLRLPSEFLIRLGRIARQFLLGGT